MFVTLIRKMFIFGAKRGEGWPVAWASFTVSILSGPAGDDPLAAGGEREAEMVQPQGQGHEEEGQGFQSPDPPRDVHLLESVSMIYLYFCKCLSSRYVTPSFFTCIYLFSSVLKTFIALSKALESREGQLQHDCSSLMILQFTNISEFEPRSAPSILNS